MVILYPTIADPGFEESAFAIDLGEETPIIAVFGDLQQEHVWYIKLYDLHLTTPTGRSKTALTVNSKARLT